MAKDNKVTTASSPSAVTPVYQEAHKPAVVSQPHLEDLVKPIAKNGAAENGVKEAKDVRWKRLVNSRVPKVLHRIRQLVPLGSRVQYDYTAEDVAKMLAALRKEIDAVERAHTGERAATSQWAL
jgi:hypothetical protein